MQNILSSVGVKATPEEAEAQYNELITESYVLGFDGQVIAEPKNEAFNIDVLAQYKDKAKKDDATKSSHCLSARRMERPPTSFQWWALDFGVLSGAIWL
jgi:hypothetical protein